MSRRDHEQYYTIDWKYQAKDRSLPAWPETREDMQARLERSLAHILDTYTGAGTSNSKYKDHDLSIVFVTHASAVNGKFERSGIRENKKENVLSAQTNFQLRDGTFLLCWHMNM